jgi:hypothetical protein
MSESTFVTTKYCQFGGLAHQPGDANNQGELMSMGDSSVFNELEMGRHPEEVIRGKKKDGKPVHTPMSNLFNCFAPVELSETVEPFVTEFLKGGDYEEMMRAEAKNLGIDTADMSIKAIRISVMMKKAKAEEPEIGEEKEDLNDLTVPQLKDKAAELEVPDFDKIKLKADLIAAIEAKQVQDAEEEEEG